MSDFFRLILSFIIVGSLFYAGYTYMSERPSGSLKKEKRVAVQKVEKKNPPLQPVVTPEAETEIEFEESDEFCDEQEEESEDNEDSAEQALADASSEQDDDGDDDFDWEKAETEKKIKRSPRRRKVSRVSSSSCEELRSRIEKLRKTIQRLEHQIEFYNFKIYLHNKCRSCDANCRPQGTGACRHYWRGEFDGKMHRASHQLPRYGKKRYDGINRAVSALQVRIDGCRRNIAMIEERIEKLEKKIKEKEAAGEE